METKTLNEDKLREYLKRWFPDLTKAKDQYSKYDCYSINKKTLIELKCRPDHYDDLLMEKKKYDSLIVYKGKASIYYICSTSKGIYSFDVLKIINPKWSKRLLPKTTDYKNKDKVLKDVTYLNIKDAIKLCD